MSSPNKDNFDKNAAPQPVADNKVLHPLFGTYTRTESFNVKNTKQGTAQHLHYEAHLDDPVKKTWTVSKIVTDTYTGFDPNRAKTTAAVHLVKNKVNFKEALELLGSLEKDCKTKPQIYDTLYPDAPVMGFAHYRAFAEREGYVYDINGKSHARPNEQALAPGFVYSQTDIDSANAKLQRNADEFDNNGPASKLPNTHFLLDNFTKAANKNDFQTSTNGLRALNILDRFVGYIEQAQQSLDDYCKKYTQMGQGGLIDDAETALGLAESSLRQLRAYGVDTAEYDNFVIQCRVAANVLHAEGLYDLMNKGKGDFNANEALFQNRVKQALDAFKKIETSENAHRTLENMIVQSPAPTVPNAIGEFVTRYRAQRAKFPDASPSAGGTPKTPKP